MDLPDRLSGSINSKCRHLTPFYASVNTFPILPTSPLMVGSFTSSNGATSRVMEMKMIETLTSVNCQINILIKGKKIKKSLVMEIEPVEFQKGWSTFKDSRAAFK